MVKLLLAVMFLMPFAMMGLSEDNSAMTPVLSTSTAADFPADPAIAAPQVTLKNNDPGEQVSDLVDAVHKKEWGVAVGLGLMLVVYMIGFFWKSLPSTWMPWMSVFLGVMSTAAIDLSAGRPWWRALLAGFTTGTSATGFWELIGKKLAGSRTSRLDSRTQENQNEEKG